MKEKWNNRYSSDEYYFGKEPNDFLKEEIDKLSASKALFIGEGEGRNSVYAATLGWNVDAIDVSDVGKSKALKLAEENKVSINYILGDAIKHQYPSNTYDAICVIYFHVQKDQREAFNKNILNSLKQNGTLIILVYDEEHLKNNNGGPSDISLLYTLEEFAEDFIDLDFIAFSKEQVSRIKKDRQQEATVIKFVGRKI